MTKQESKKDDEDLQAGLKVLDELSRLMALAEEEKKRERERGIISKLRAKFSRKPKPKLKRIKVDFSPEEWQELERLGHLHEHGTPEEREVADKELAKFAMKYMKATATPPHSRG